MKKKIIWITHEGAMSGAIISMMECIQLLKKEGFEQYIIAPSIGTLKLAAEKEGIPFYMVPSYSWAVSMRRKIPERILIKVRKFIRNILAVSSIKHLIQNIKPDIVITNSIANNVGALAAKKSGIPHYWFVREFGEEDHGFSIAGNAVKGAKIINALSEKVLFNSIATKNKFSPYIDKGKSHIIYNAVQVKAPNIKMIDETIFQLLLLGQIAPSKNHFEAIEAVAICKNQGMHLHLNLVGKCDLPVYKKDIIHLIEKNSLINDVTICEPVSNPVEVIQQHHALLMCSRMEAFGRVTVEAIKCGVPVIAANSGGSIEIIQDGINGYLYEPNNVVDLATKIQHLHKNYSQIDRNSMVKNIEQRFNEDNTLTQLLEVLK